MFESAGMSAGSSASGSDLSSRRFWRSGRETVGGGRNSYNAGVRGSVSGTLIQSVQRACRRYLRSCETVNLACGRSREQREQVMDRGREAKTVGLRS